MFRKICATASIVLLSGGAWAHDDDASLGGEHPVHPPSALELLGQALVPDAEAAATITVRGNTRVISANGLPDHKTGRFPNRNNPNSIRRQNYQFTVPARPRKSGRTTQLVRQPFGVALNGVLFDPGTAEFWNNDPRSGWNYEAIGGPLNLGLDRNNAHVQPNGAYHYHGIPVGLLAHYSSASAPVLVGYAADGFPIYGPYGYANPDRPSGKLVKLRSSYRLKGAPAAAGRGDDPTARLRRILPMPRAAAISMTATAVPASRRNIPRVPITM
ncbi:YHYH protein [Breoghania sp. L-A4]|uniref:YHYH protein n=1 Tax=Breoghania sp. L-A4 TaxID=2304600 RepID=UPI0019679062